MRFAALVLKNLGRNKLRTILTGLAVMVLVSIFVIVTSVTSMLERRINNEASRSKLMVTEKWVVPSKIPARYTKDMTDIAGVVDWTTWNFYGGFFDESRRQDMAGAGFATRMDNLTSMHAGLEDLDKQLIEAMSEERTGALVGPGLMDQMNWRVGQKFRFFGATHPGQNLEFVIVGVLPSGDWSRVFFFHDAYFREATGDKANVNIIWLRVADADAAQRVASQVARKFENSQPQVKVETESAGIARFAGRVQAVFAIINMVVTVLLIDMIIILSNSISITVRERRGEMAVLKVLGFQPYHILVMVVSEAMLVGALAGGAGTGLVFAISELTHHGILPQDGWSNFFLMFPVQVDSVVWGIMMGMFVGLVGSIVPAWNARSIKVTEVFSRIA